ncbi:MAG: type II toxin-antitoxin system HipA family toxin [Treponema sp.]|nr:type II toxin-antitoxin system HipA family toxin [Treponema sp.]
MKRLDHCLVRLWNQNVGVLLWDEVSQTASFQYTKEFLQTKLQISPIKMPIQKQLQNPSHVYQFKELVARDDRSSFWGLPGVFADSLPERFGNRMMQKWLETQNIDFKDLNPIERLCYVGKRGMGALEFEPAEEFFTDDHSKIDVDEMIQIARQILKEANENKAQINAKQNVVEQIISITTSAGGAKAKAIIAAQEDDKGNFINIYSGQAEPKPDYSYWLLKFANTENDEHLSDTDTGRLEFAYYLMAKACGIEMVECRLLPDSNGVGHFMTRRFDRVNGQKIHMATFCGIAHEDRNPVGMSSYEKLFKCCRDLKLSQDRQLQLYKRMVFNILARNQDDHTKNHSFLMFQDGKWDLSPAYDLCYSYEKTSRFIALQQLRCNDKRDNFTKDDLLATAASAKIDADTAEKIIKEVQTGIDSWEELATKAGLKQSQTQSIRQAFRKL